MTGRLLHKANDFRLSDFDFRSLSERDLSRLWRDQTFPAEALVTSAGERLRVVYRGRPGAGSGPDFRDAMIAAPGGLLQGDVELHVRSSDFRRHGHDRDPAYAGVVLHLVFSDDEGGLTSLPGGGQAPVVALGDWALGRAAEIRRWLQRPALWREPCFSSLRRLGSAEVKATLERLGEIRFRKKADSFARRLRDMEQAGRRNEEAGSKAARILPSASLLLPDAAAAEQVLWEALLEALAFGHASERFGLLAQRLPWSVLSGRLTQRSARERAGEALRLLAGASDAIPQAGRPGGGRPAGRPEKRLQGAAQLAARFAGGGLMPAFVDVLEKGSPPVESNYAKTEKAKSNKGSSAVRISNLAPPLRAPRHSERRIVASLTALLTVPGLIGRSRAVEIAGNAVLPLLAALGPEARTRRAEALYRRLPLPARYGAVRHLHQALGALGPEKRELEAESGPSRFAFPGSYSHRPEGREDLQGVRIDFRRQQGMLYLLRNYCTRGGCGRCPLS